jgi:ribonucleoside-diphosphate reductase alpha chain
VNDLREFIWKKQYALGNESYLDGLRRVATNVALAEEPEQQGSAAQAFFEAMHSNKFIPGGRILAGAGSAHGNMLNCLHGDTLVQTREGVFPIRALVGERHQVLTRNNTWRWAEFREFGQQELYRVVLSNGEEVLATANHRWYTRKGICTTQGLVGKRIPVMATYIRPPRNDDYYQGVRHGLVYGDGSKNTASYTYTLRLFGRKQSLAEVFEGYAKVAQKRYGGREQVMVSVPGGHYKELPPTSASDSYWYGFFCGLLAVDGCVDELGSVIVHSADAEALQTVAKQLKRFGIAYASLKCTRELSPYDGSHKPVYGLRLLRRTLMLEDFLREDHRQRFLANPHNSKHSSLKVVAVEPTGLSETVYCAVEPETHSFVLAGGLLTGNCFVVDGAPEPSGSDSWALLLAKKLALVTKVGGGTGINLDPFKPRRPFKDRTGDVYIYINPAHPNSDDVYEGRIVHRFTGEKVEQGYKVATVLVDKKDAPEHARWLYVWDSIEAIWDNAAEMVQLLLQGKDVVVSLDMLRPEGEWVSGSGGRSSGPASFAVEIFDNYARWAMRGGAEYAGPVAALRYLYAPTLRVIKQGDSRRGAGMATLRVTHPDVQDFITCKDLEREAAEGDISTFNISVLVDQDTMERYRANDREAVALMRSIAEHAHATGEPGVLFVDTINANNPLAAIDGPIVTTNPCGEIPLFPGEPCDLGAINLAEFVSDGVIDYEGLAQTARLAVRFLDDVLTVEKAPLEDITQAIADKRRIGLGLMGLADALIKLGISYDSQAGREVAAKLFDTIVKAGLEASKELAQERGVPTGVRRAGLARRNIALFTVAPTGTTSMIAGVSSGIEPVFAAAYDRRIDTQVHKVLHPLLVQLLEEPSALEWARQARVPTVKDGQWNLELVIEGIGKAHGSVQPLVELGWLPPWFASFQVAHDIAPEAHVLMQAAIQRVMDQEMAGNSISKTINLPNQASLEDVLSAYVLAHDKGAKGCTVYRDGSRAFQVLSVGEAEEDFESWAARQENAVPVTMRVRERVVRSLTHKYAVGGRKVYVTVGWNQAGEVVETFINLSKPTPNEAVVADLVGRLLSVAFKHGADLKDVVKHLEGHFDQSGGLAEGLGFVNSVWEVVAHALRSTQPDSNVPVAVSNMAQKGDCPECGGPIVRKGGCNKCEKCGYETCG